mgnify:CR=1 FL=1
MAFQRREGLAGGGITKYADNNFKCCPFCGSKEPHWLTDAYIANYSLISSKCLNGYKFQCEKCGGILEIQGNTDFCFQRESFALVKLVSTGSGTMNQDKLEKPLTIAELKRLCSESAIKPEEKQEEPQVQSNQEINRCPKCGKEYKEGQKFCSQCGTNLTINELKLEENDTPVEDSGPKVEENDTPVEDSESNVEENDALVVEEDISIQTEEEKEVKVAEPKQEQKVVIIKRPIPQPRDRGPWKVFAKLGNIFGVILFVLAFIPYFNLLSCSFSVFSIVFSALGIRSKDHKGKAIVGLVFSILALIFGFILYVVYTIALFDNYN